MQYRPSPRSGFGPFAAACLLLAATTAPVAATHQVGDVLVFEGAELQIPVFPLESYPLTTLGRRLRTAPSKVNSGIQRGYVATWQVDGDRLWLLNIDGWLCDDLDICEPATLEAMFPAAIDDGRVLADWFSGRLVYPGLKWGGAPNPVEAAQLEQAATLVIEVRAGVVTRVDDRRCASAMPPAQPLELPLPPPHPPRPAPG